MGVALVAAGLLGSLIGSFLNVVVYRVPRRLSVVNPPSACPNCGAGIRAIDNVPVLSWLILRGRCRDCGTAISPRYPLVELGTALFFVPVAFVFFPTATTALGVASDVVVLVAFLALAAVSVSLALIDLDTSTLPNRIVVPALVTIAVLLAVAAALRGDPGAIIRALVGGAALFLFYLALALVSRGGMGMGDVKLAALLGLATAWVGWPALVVGAFAAFVLGGVFALVLLIARRVGRRSSVPFGPWMLAGAWIGIFFGDALWQGYAHIIGLAGGAGG
ncbi:prepilin peptidase [Antiquaquibacter oligotrophicus]|nr:prepilin peptidase [Antiquaquibacter oligotrophicus]